MDQANYRRKSARSCRNPEKGDPEPLGENNSVDFKNFITAETNCTMPVSLIPGEIPENSEGGRVNDDVKVAREADNPVENVDTQDQNAQTDTPVGNSSDNVNTNIGVNIDLGNQFEQGVEQIGNQAQKDHPAEQQPPLVHTPAESHDHCSADGDEPKIPFHALQYQQKMQQKDVVTSTPHSHNTALVPIDQFETDMPEPMEKCAAEGCTFARMMFSTTCINCDEPENHPVRKRSCQHCGRMHEKIDELYCGNCDRALKCQYCSRKHYSPNEKYCEECRNVLTEQEDRIEKQRYNQTQKKVTYSNAETHYPEDGDESSGDDICTQKTACCGQGSYCVNEFHDVHAEINDIIEGMGKLTTTVGYAEGKIENANKIRKYEIEQLKKQINDFHRNETQTQKAHMVEIKSKVAHLEQKQIDSEKRNNTQIAELKYIVNAI